MQNVSRHPTLLMLAGLPGSGKSTLAAALAAVLRWPVLDKDVLNSVLLAAQLEQAQAGPLAYELILTLAHTLIVKQRQSIILDTAGRQPVILARSRAIVQEASGRLKVIRCIAPMAVRQARLQQRVAEPSQWTADQTTPDQEAAWYAHLPVDTLMVATDQPIEALLPLILAFIRQVTRLA